MTDPVARALEILSAPEGKYPAEIRQIARLVLAKEEKRSTPSFAKTFREFFRNG